jgi:hypothetical protein
MRDLNARISNLQINLPHIWDSFDMMDRRSDKGYESRNSKDKVINSEGKKLVKLCERNMMKILNGKYGQDHR